MKHQVCKRENQMSMLTDISLIFKVKDLTSLVKSNIESSSTEGINPIYRIKLGNQLGILLTINYCGNIPRLHFIDHDTGLSSKFVGYVFDSEKTIFSKDTMEDADIFFPLVNISEERMIEEINSTLQKKTIEFIEIREVISFRDLSYLSKYVESLNYVCNFIYEFELLEKKKIFFQVISIDRNSLTLLLTNEGSLENVREIRKNVRLIELRECSICNHILQLLEGVRE